MRFFLSFVLIIFCVVSGLSQATLPSYQYKGPVDSNPNDGIVPIVIPSIGGSYTNCSSSGRPKFGYMSSDFDNIDELVGKGPTNNVWGIPLNFRPSRVGIYSVIPRYRERISKPFQSCYEREYNFSDYIFILVHPVNYFNRITLPINGIEFPVSIIPINQNQFSGGACQNNIEVGYSSNFNKMFDLLETHGRTPKYDFGTNSEFLFNPNAVGLFKLNVHSRFVTIGGGGCSAKTYSQIKDWGSIEIEVENFTWKENEIPTVVCLNSTAINLGNFFNVPVSKGVTFEGPGVSAGNFNPSTAGLGIHTIRARKVYSSGTEFEDVTITVVNKATLSSRLPANTCNSIDLTQFFSANIKGGTWTFTALNPSNNNSTGGVSGNILNPNNTTIPTIKINAVYNVGGCLSETITADIGVVPGGSGALSITNASSYCQANGQVNLGMTLNSATAASVIWSGTGVSGSILNLNNVEAGTDTNVLLRVITSTGCELNTSKIIRVNPSPVLNTSTSEVSFCNTGQTINLNNEFQLRDGSVVINGNWSGSGISIGSGSSVNLTSVSQGNYNLTASYINSSGCSSILSLNSALKVYEQPSSNINVTINPSEDVCTTTNFSLSANTISSNLGYNWFTPGGYLGSTRNISTGNLTTGEYKMLLVINNNSNGLCRAEKSFTLTVENPTPLTLNTNLVSVCQGDYILSLPSKITGNYQDLSFYSTNSTISSAFQGEFGRTLNLNNIPNGNYTITASKLVGNCVVEKNFTLNIYSEYANPVVNGNSILCTPQTTTLNVSGADPQLEYRWFNTNSASEAPFRINTTYTTPILATNTTYYLQAYNAATKCSSLKAPINIIVQRMDTVAVFAGEDYASCTNAVSFSLIRAGVKPSNGFWSGPGVSGSNFNGASLLNNKAYQVIYSVTRDLCTKRDTILVTLGIDLQPKADKYVVNTGDIVKFSHNYPNATATIWNLSDNIRSVDKETSAIYYRPGTKNVTLSITINQNGTCTGTITKNAFITVNSDDDDIITDVEEPVAKDSDLKVFPVPFKDVLKVNSEVDLGLSLITLYSNNGTLILQKEMKIGSGDVILLDKQEADTITEGIYYLKVKNRNSDFSFKVLKEY